MAFSLAKELSNCCCCCEQLRLMQPTLTKTDDRVGKFSAKIIRKLSVSTRSSNFFFFGGGLRAFPFREKDILFEFMIYEEVVWTRSRRRKRAQQQQHSSKIRVIAAIEIGKNEITGGHQVSMNCVFSKCHLQLMLTIHFLHSIYHFSETPFNTN